MTIPYPINIAGISTGNMRTMADAINDLNARLANIEQQMREHYHGHGAPVQNLTTMASWDCVDAAPVSAPAPEPPTVNELLTEQANAAPASAPTPCVCGDPSTQGVVHRTDGPCYHTQPAAPGDDAAVDALMRIVTDIVIPEKAEPAMIANMDATSLRVVKAELDAIRAGQVPGIAPLNCGELGLMAAKNAEIAALKDKLAATKPTGPMQDGIPRTDHVICPHCTCQFQAISQDAQAMFDNLRADLALCECENREKQATIERLMEEERKMTAALDGISAYVRAAYEQEFEKDEGSPLIDLIRHAFVTLDEARRCLVQTHTELAEARKILAVSMPTKEHDEQINRIGAELARHTADSIRFGGHYEPCSVAIADTLRSMMKDNSRMAAELAEAKARADRLTAELTAMTADRDTWKAQSGTNNERANAAVFNNMKLNTELAEAKATLHATELSVHTWHDAEAKAQAELAEAKAEIDRTLQKAEALHRELTEAKARKFVVTLPPRRDELAPVLYDEGNQNYGYNQAMDLCAAAIVAAGGSVKS